MSISELGSLGEFVGSLAVLATLIYLAMQIRQNTHTTRAVSHHAITDALNQLNLTLARDEAAARLWMTGLRDRASLNDLERERFDALLRAYLHVCDTMYYQAQLGAGDHGLWKAEERYLGLTMLSDGGREWFQEHSESISAGFRDALVEIGARYRPSAPEPSGGMRTRYGIDPERPSSG
ncbi:MAG: hypothetical protein GWM88_15410 [Pseudomonadales bacterium]|nr:hypothetical protein [Pseudomonadales bacterium]NIX09325.1 hypothetical protein [Pseudomonadales bacterium]